MTKFATVLMIDADEREQRAFDQMVRERKLQWEVKVAETMSAARALLAGSRIDVIIADHQLSDGQSLDLLAEFPGVPFVLITSTLEERSALRTLQRGADDYIVRDSQRQCLELLPLVVEKTLLRRARAAGLALDITERLEAGDASRQSEKKLQSLVESIPDHAVITLDARGRITTWNPGAERIFGWTKDEIIGKPVDVLFTPEDRGAGVPGRELEQARRRGQSRADRWQVRKDGTRFYAAESVGALAGEDGKPPSYVKIASDATHQKLAERVLWEGDKANGASWAVRSRLARYATAAVLGVLALGALWLVSPLFDGKGAPWMLVSLAVAAAAWWGGVGPGLLTTALTSLVGWWAFVPEHSSFAGSDAAEVFRWSAFVASSVAISALAGGIHRANERQKLSVARLAAEADERRRMEAAVRERAQMLEQSYDAAMAWPLHGTITYWNSGAARLYGFSRAEAIGRSPQELLRTQVDGGLEACFAALERDGRWSGELTQQTRDGRQVIVESRMVLMPDESGRAGVVIESTRDVTERRQAEAKLRESELFYRQTLESIPGMVFTTRPDGYCDYHSQQWEDYTGVPTSQQVGTNWNKLLHPDDQAGAYAAWRAAVEERGSYDVEYRVRRRDGQYEWFNVKGRPIRDSSGQIVRWFGVATNINDLKRSAEALHRGAQNLQLLSKTATRLLMEDSPKEALRDIFPELSAHLGMELFFKFLVSEDEERLILQASGGIDDATVRRLQQADITESISGVVARQRRAVVVEDVQNSTDPAAALIRSLGLTAYACHPLLARGRLVGTLGFGTRSRIHFNPDELDLLRTVSDQVAMALERKRLVTELEQRADELTVAKASADAATSAAEQANRAKDRFLAVLSHELRNPLTPVLAAATLLGQGPGVSADMREGLEVIRRNAELEARLIDDLLDVTRIARGKLQLNRKPVRVCTILSRAIEVCQPDIDARRLHFGSEIVGGPHVVNVDAARLQQVFWNVLKNAIKFTPNEGCIGARCWREDSLIIVEIRDSGIGIEQEALQRIFNAFEQAEPIMTRRFGGLGLGLAISKAIVEMHGGTIVASSKGKGHGATFTIKLPVHAAQPQMEPAQPGKAAPALEAAGLRILLVEDHGDTSRIMARLLRSSGHTVQTAGDVATAVLQAEAKTFDLLISDLGLPDGSGIDLLNQLRASGHDYPAIAMTGFGQEEDIARTRAAGFTAHLVKPIDLEQMTRTIAEAAGPAQQPQPVTPRHGT